MWTAVGRSHTLSSEVDTNVDVNRKGNLAFGCAAIAPLFSSFLDLEPVFEGEATAQSQGLSESSSAQVSLRLICPLERRKFRLALSAGRRPQSPRACKIDLVTADRLRHNFR